MIHMWARQAAAVARLELRRYIAARRWVGVYLLALIPILLFLPGALVGPPFRPTQTDLAYAGVFQAYVLRFAIFVSCGVVFSQLFRGETLEKTLHFYLLAPVRREVLAAGKYLAALVATTALFGISTAATYLMLYFPGGGSVLALASYLGVAALGCASYGAVFILLGLLVKNASVPGVMLLGWESVSFALPATLQRFSIVYYLQPMLPAQIDRGPFAVVAEAPSALLAIPILITFSAGLVAIAAWRARSLEITYGAD
jgi:ABC-type transport system involved in multi-copper enzyme maturation permease subunit